MATRDSPLDRLFPLFEHTHDRVTTALVVVFAALLGVVASWVVADFGVRFPAFLVGSVAVGYLLYGRESRRAVLAGGLYMLAALVALTPIVSEIHVLTVAGMRGVGDPWQHVLTVSDLLLVVVFFLVAAVPALAAFLLQNWAVVRARLARRWPL